MLLCGVWLPLLQGRTSKDKSPSAAFPRPLTLPDAYGTSSQESASRAQGEMLGAGGPQGVTEGARRKLHCHSRHLNRPTHTSCNVAWSVPSVICLHVKGRPQTSVLLTEHRPGTPWGNHHRGHYRGIQGHKASGFNVTKKYILRWILKTQVTHVRRQKWGKSFGTGTRVGRDSGRVWGQVCRAAWARRPGHSDITYRGLFSSNWNGI